MTEAVIRRATLADAAVLAAISAETFSATFAHLYPPEDLASFLAEAYAVEALRETLVNPRMAAWLMEAHGQVVGHALAGPCGLPHPEGTPQSGELKRLYLTPAWQGGGRGTRLLDTALAWLVDQGFDPLWLGVWSENHAAQRLYERHGFERVGEYRFKVGQTLDHEFILRRA